MKKNLCLFVIVMGAVIALNSCKKDYLVEVNGVVQGTVRDDYNNPLKGVDVSIDDAKVKVTTDTLGYYKISGVEAGNHILVFSKAGYTTSRQNFWIEVPTEVTNTTSGKKQSYDYYAVVNQSLYTLGGKLKGYVKYNGVALALAKVTVYLDASYEPNTYTTTTDEKGAYYFDKLPVRSIMTVVAFHPSEPGYEGAIQIYPYYSSGGYVTADGVLMADEITVSTESLQFVKGDYFRFENNSLSNDKVDTTANITLTFSDNISQVITQNKGGFVQLRNYSTGLLVASTITYSGNKITIDPANSLSENTRYYVYFEVYMSDSKFVSNTSNYTSTYYNFYTVPRAVAALSGKPVFTIVSEAVHLTTATTNAKGYDIYASNGKNEFARIAIERTLASDYNIASYATGTQFYIVPVTYDSYGVRTYGTASDVVTK